MLRGIFSYISFNFFFKKITQVGRLETDLQNPHEKMMRRGGMCLESRCRRGGAGDPRDP